SSRGRETFCGAGSNINCLASGSWRQRRVRGKPSVNHGLPGAAMTARGARQGASGKEFLEIVGGIPYNNACNAETRFLLTPRFFIAGACLALLIPERFRRRELGNVPFP